MNKILLLSSFVFSFYAFATSAKAPVENVSADYLRQLINESKQLKAFQENFKKNPRVFCPQYKGPDESTCLKAFIMSTEIHSSSHAVLLSTLAASTGVNDKNLGYSPEMTRLLMLENVIVLFERVDLSKFYLAKMNPRTNEGKAELKDLKKSDEKLLADSFKKMQGALLKVLSKVESNRGVANVEEWKKNKLTDLKSRLEKLKKTSWKYPG